MPVPLSFRIYLSGTPPSCQPTCSSTAPTGYLAKLCRLPLGLPQRLLLLLAARSLLVKSKLDPAVPGLFHFVGGQPSLSSVSLVPFPLFTKALVTVHEGHPNNLSGSHCICSDPIPGEGLGLQHRNDGGHKSMHGVSSGEEHHLGMEGP